jgi:hypothetical protein
MITPIIKKSEQRVDPKDPNTNPAYHKMLEKADMAKSHLKFENEADERDYRKSIEANPNNVYGLPAFYPPLKIKPSCGFGDGARTEKLPCGHSWRTMGIRGNDVFYKCAYGHEYNRNEEQIG